MKEFITHSRQDCFKVCRRKHYFAYELGLRRTEDAEALRIGSAFHAGIAALGMGQGVDYACGAVRAHYAHLPEAFDPREWLIECETVMRLVCAYDWRWASAKLVNVETEFAFELPLVNPATGKPTPLFDLAGKIDGIVRLEDGRLAVKETKTVSDDVGQSSTLWRRLRMDHQISLYIHAARLLGYPVDTVLYDVVRKPTIGATDVPIVDRDGMKIVLDTHGERVKTKQGWRQTGDRDKGYTLQVRPMTPEEWGQKLTDDICERPDYYFARVEVPRLDQDVEEYRQELWEIQQAIREAQRSGRHYRTVNRHTCGYCPYFDVCSTNMPVDAAHVPYGFTVLTDVHPELGRRDHVELRTAPRPTIETPATAPTAEPAAV